MTDFVQEKNEELVKVILIHGMIQSVSRTKEAFYAEYEKYISLKNVYVQHVSEEYNEVARLSAYKKVLSFKKHVQSIKRSIPLEEINGIVQQTVDRVLSKEIVTEMCFEAVIQESGNINSGPYCCRSIFTVYRLRKELVKQTLESVSEYLGSEISTELEKRFSKYININCNLDTNVLFLPIKVLIQTLLLALIAAYIYPYVGIVAGIASLFVNKVDVNSESWRRGVASEIYDKVSKNRQAVVKEATSNTMQRCKIPLNHLDNIIEQLDHFSSAIEKL